jgi:uncharacterized metal-binding protein YceD (DUF177 family)
VEKKIFMLKISVIQIDNEGIDFSGTVSPDMLGLDMLSDMYKKVNFEQQIAYDLHVSLVSDGILIAGTLSTKVKCSCGRCLEDFNLDFTHVKVCHFHEEIKCSEFDIAPDLREDLLIKLPMKFTCREDCPGIEYDNNKSESQKKAEEELNSENDAWSGLEDLKL